MQQAVIVGGRYGAEIRRWEFGVFFKETHSLQLATEASNVAGVINIPMSSSHQF